MTKFHNSSHPIYLFLLQSTELEHDSDDNDDTTCQGHTGSWCFHTNHLKSSAIHTSLSGFFCFVEIASHYVGHTGLKLVILLSQPHPHPRGLELQAHTTTPSSLLYCFQGRMLNISVNLRSGIGRYSMMLFGTSAKFSGVGALIHKPVRHAPWHWFSHLGALESQTQLYTLLCELMFSEHKC
jgi:hypothetical protein